MIRLRTLAPLAAALGAALAFAPARAARSAEKVNFARDVKPVLEAACMKCHGLKDPKGRYRLDNKVAAFKGGEVALKAKKPAIVAGKPDDSLFVKFIEATEKDEATHVEPMPPRKETRRLSEEERATLRRWIAEGAVWPEGVTLTPPPDSGRRKR